MTHQSNMMLLLLFVSGCSSSSASFCSSFPENSDDGQEMLELLAEGVVPPSGGLRGVEAGERRRGNREEEVEELKEIKKKLEEEAEELKEEGG